MNKSMIAVCIFSVVVLLQVNASAGFLDAFNKVQQAVSTVENMKNTAQRAGAIVPKSNKEPAKPSQPAEVKPVGSMTAKDKAAIEKAKRAWVAAFKSEDWDALVDNYAENAVLLAPD